MIIHKQRAESTKLFVRCSSSRWNLSPWIFSWTCLGTFCVPSCWDDECPWIIPFLRCWHLHCNCNRKGDCGAHRTWGGYKNWNPILELTGTDPFSYQLILLPHHRALELLPPLLCCGAGAALAVLAALVPVLLTQAIENKNCNSSSPTGQRTRIKAGPFPSHLRRNLCLGAFSASPLPWCSSRTALQTQPFVHFSSSHSQLHPPSLSAAWIHQFDIHLYI